MIDLKISQEELDILKKYIDNDYKAINQILVSDSENDIALISDEVENTPVEILYSKETVIEYIKSIKIIYRLILKIFYSKKLGKKESLYRGTNLAEYERFKNEAFIDRFLVATYNKEEAKELYAKEWNRPCLLKLDLDLNIPFVNLQELDEIFNNTVLVAPFTKIKNIIECDEEIVNAKDLKIYEIALEKQELEKLNEKERNSLYTYILENAYSINKKIEECIVLEKENVVNFENIRKLEQLLNKLEVQEDKEEIEQLETDDINRINKELEEYKEKSNKLFEKRKSYINFINIWKRNIAVYLMAECNEIENEFSELKLNYLEEIKKLDITENCKIIDEKIEDEQVQEKEISNDKMEDVTEKNEETKIVPVITEIKLNIEDEDKNSFSYKVKNSCKENIEVVKELVKNINNLIKRQQNHAKIAGIVNANYSALNNAFEMRKNAEKLLANLNDVFLNINLLLKNEKENEKKLELILKNNIEISTLLNYLNNPKIATVNSGATRFDEMEIIEENQLKMGIATKIREIRGEAELKKLNDEIDIIEDKNIIMKFFGFFTGQNKLDEFTMDQIEIRKNAIRRTLAKKLSLAYNYSIHELLAEIEMFIDDNADDELIINDVKELEKIGEELKRNYVISDSKVQNIIRQRDGKEYPLNLKKLSRKDIIEIETYRFLNKYKYDLNDRVYKEEPKYQDTMANEINRILEYVNGFNF